MGTQRNRKFMEEMIMKEGRCKGCIEIKEVTEHHLVPKRTKLQSRKVKLCRKCHNVADVLADLLYPGNFKKTKLAALKEEHEEDNKKALEEEKEKNDLVNHPSHYTQTKIEVIDIIEMFSLCFHLGNTVKYVLRAKHKDNESQDLQKAKWYLDRKIKQLEGKE